MSLNFLPVNQGYYPSLIPSTLVRTVETGYIEASLFPTFYKHTVVEFSVPAQWGSCKFDVYRSENNTGPWTKLTPAPISGTFFKDVSSMAFSKFKNQWYIVECILPNNRRVQGIPVTWQNKRNKWVDIRAKEIERRETLLLEKFTGVRSIIFRKKNYGMRCTQCWNPSIEKVTQDHCPSCLGTSFEGGYFEGFETLFQFDQTPNEANLDYRGAIEANVIAAWTISFPDIEVFDLVLRVPDWRMFRVDKIMSTELQTVGVRQLLSLTELAKESIEFKLASQAMPEGY